MLSVPHKLGGVATNLRLRGWGGGGGGVKVLMVSLFAEIVTFSFWPKTMDYSKAF